MIVENIEKIFSDIEKYNPGAKLIAATKMQSIEMIREAMDTGKVFAAGENKVQEFIEKYSPDFRWDFIGQLQTNKVKYIIDKVSLIHSVDRMELADAINKQALKHNKKQDVLIEINSGKEDSKGGIYLENAVEFYENMQKFQNINVKGFMAVAPMNYDEKQLRNTFDEVYKVYRSLENENFCYLSMGMSNDYCLALKSGANLIRLGRAIFGERIYNNG